MNGPSHKISLHVFQQAIQRLATWTKVELSHQVISDYSTIISQAKDLLFNRSDHSSNPLLDDDVNPGVLKSVFDAIALQHGTQEQHFWQPGAIANEQPRVPYPVTESEAAAQLDQLKNELKEVLKTLNAADWQNLSLLTLIVEKYGSFISYGEADIALYDLVKMTAAVASGLVVNPDSQNLYLIAGDLSGVQDFIYTITSDGALKSLRARSFFLELVTEEVVQQLLAKLKLPRTSVIYAGGGNLYILAPETATTAADVEALRRAINDWLLDTFQKKVFLGLVSYAFPTEDVGSPTFAEKHWEGAIKELSKQKNRKFITQLESLLGQQDAHEPCRVCHRDDLANDQLKPLGGDGPQACPSCHEMRDLGQQLFNVKAIVRTHDEQISGAEPIDKLAIKIGSKTVYYHLFKGSKPYLPEPRNIYLINNWDLSLYQQNNYQNPTTLLLGDYGQKEKDPDTGIETFMTTATMAERSTGIKRVGHLRMDVDRLGQIFAKGLGRSYNLPRLSGLSRQMSYFFKVYLNSLAETRHDNLPPTATTLTTSNRDNLLFIYAGGDDLFVSGVWNEVVEFAFDVYQGFRAYTGHHPDITLSGGISLNGPKYPLYQSADDSGRAESAAKTNGRDSLTLFDQTFKWEMWLGHQDTKVSDIPAITDEIKNYLKDDSLLSLYGILPFVNVLNQVVDLPHSFVQNLLATAQLQEQTIKSMREKTRIALKQQTIATEKDKLKDKAKADVRDIRYFLHLPKVAYTLARLPIRIRDDNMNKVTSSLKSPYNAPYFRAIATWLDLLNRNSISS